MNMKTNQNGFSAVAALLVVVVIALVGLAGWRVSTKSDGIDSKQQQQTASSNNSSASSKEPDLELQNIGLQSIEDVEVTTQAVREYRSNGLKGFYVFGDKLSGNRLNPNFEYASLRSGAKAVSAIDGVVAFIKEQASNKDSEVFIQPKEGSKWTVGYDHLINVTVKKGDVIKAGDVIGEPAPQNNGLLRFEIQINNKYAK
jgi:preprotein translocase subunit SecF